MTYAIFPAFAIVAILGFIQAILFFISRTGGWNTLSRAYPGKLVTPAKTWMFRCIRLNDWCGYNNIVTIWANAEGFQLSMPWFFSVGHDPIFVPWEDTSVEEVKILQWFPAFNLKFRKCPDVTLQLSKDLYILIKTPCNENS